MASSAPSTSARVLESIREGVPAARGFFATADGLCVVSDARLHAGEILHTYRLNNLTVRAHEHAHEPRRAR
jgi:hypothetical protein